MAVKLTSLALITASAFAFVPPLLYAQSDTAQAAAQRTYQIAAGDLGNVLHQILSGSALTLAMPADIVQGRTSAGVRGQFTPQGALQQALHGTGLQLVSTTSGALTLVLVGEQTSDATQGQQLPAVVVTTSRPVATTQGSGTYAAPYVTIGKGLATLRETPYSVSVVTRDQLDDQNAVSLGDAMSYVTGIGVFTTSTGVVNLRSRGFRLNNYLLDGMPMRGGQGMWGSALMDMALYDRVEVWRGPASLLEGAGEPSGTINLVRKRAQRDNAIQATAMAGSWNKRRLEFDMTRALNDDGSLRARLVAVDDRSDSFVDTVNKHVSTVYGTVEYDFTPSTTLSVGYTAQRGESIAFAGLPLIAGGISPDYARSTFLGSRHGTKNDYGYSAFAELEHRTDAGGVWKTQLNEYSTRNTMHRFISNSMVNPVTREFDLEGAWQKSQQTNQGFDTSLTQPFSLWGQRRHEFTVGASYQIFKGSQIQQRYAIWRQNVDAPNHDLVLPERDLGEVPEPRSRDRAFYGSVKLRPTDRLLVLTGARFAWWDSKDPAKPDQEQAINARFVPNVGVVYDLDTQWSLYSSYNQIFSPQTERLISGAYLAPRTGKQYEFGIKGELLNQRLNTHVAVFRIDDHGRAIDDPADTNYSLPAGHVRSQGFEAEASGQITPNWRVLAGYAYTQTRYMNEIAANGDRTFDSTFPRHQFSLWTRYELPANVLSGAYVGGGMRYHAKTYANYSGVRWTQGGYSVFALQAGYAWKNGWSASLTVNNLFDKVYFERFAGGSARQTYYGDPANVMLTVRAAF
jgi:outer membrane receptor for ferric coprogen and ferric-rhodotorulic acid